LIIDYYQGFAFVLRITPNKISCLLRQNYNTSIPPSLTFSRNHPKNWNKLWIIKSL